MTPETIVKFIGALGVNNAHHSGSEWVMASCPLAPFTHKNGKDSRPSFGIKIEEHGGSLFNCFTCMSGSLQTLIGTLEMYVQKRPELATLYNFPLARAYLESDAEQVVALEEFQEFKPSAYAEFEEWPLWWLQSFMPWHQSPRAVEYLMKTRNLYPEVADRFDLRYDTKDDRIVFPYYTAFGKLAGARGRTIGAYGAPHYDYAWNKVRNTRLVWYNEQALQLPGPVIVTEGQMDVLRISLVYEKVVGNMGSKITMEKMKKLEMCDSVLFMLDNDETGKMHTPKYMEHLNAKGVQVGQIEYPDEFKDPDMMGEARLRELLDDSGLSLKL